MLMGGPIFYDTASLICLFQGRDDVTGEALSQRADDQLETVMARLQSYSKRTIPVLELYKYVTRIVQDTDYSHVIRI